MILCVDVGYLDNEVKVAGIALNEWTDPKGTVVQISLEGEGLAEYVPGEFYKRELPYIVYCFQSMREFFEEDLIIVIDGYVWLNDGKKGLGAYVAEETGCPVVGIAKSSFKGSSWATPVLRGNSKRPLYVTTQGVSQEEMAEKVKSMHGKFRTPTALKTVDQLSRGIISTEDVDLD